MQTSDIVALPLRWGSAVRQRRIFHPVGVVASGSIERLAPPGEGLPVTSTGGVVARLSKALGTPGALPDIIGVAIRIPPQSGTAIPWDILMASTGVGRLTRFALHPATSWSAPMTSLMPLRHEGQYWWVRAEITTDVAKTGLSLNGVSDLIARGGIELAIDQAGATDDFQPLARLTLDGLVPEGASQELTFDPTIHSAPDVKLAPEWLTDIRRRAYQRSREGRGAAQQ